MVNFPLPHDSVFDSLFYFSFILVCSSFKHGFPPVEQLSKHEEKTDLIPAEANDSKPDVFKSDVDIICSKESVPIVITEETDDTIFHESDHERVACDVTLIGDEGLEYKTKSGTLTGRHD